MSGAARAGDGRRLVRRVDARSPLEVRDALAAALAGGPPVLPRAGAGAGTGDGEGALGAPDLTLDDTWPDDACLVIETSGSTAAPKRVVLTASALRASARATAARLDEIGAGRAEAGVAAPAHWLLCLPAEYVAGAQVLARSIFEGTEPVIASPGPFDPSRFAVDVERMPPGVCRTSLVPAQLLRLLEAAEGEAARPAGASCAERVEVAQRSDGVGAARRSESGAGVSATSAADEAARIRAAVASLDAILVGGQSTPMPVRERAAALGWRLVTTYGSSETSGGCVYNGAPLEGVEVRVVDGEVQLAGAMLAAGYLGDAARTARTFVRDERGRRWYRTGDAGTVADGGTRLAVTGRLDNVIISGGEKVLLDRVEQLVRAVDGYADAVVVGVPSDQWGEVPAVVLEDGRLGGGGPAVRGSAGGGSGAAVLDRAEELAADAGWPLVRDAASVAGRAARPAHRIRIASLPRLVSGKPDRRSIAELASALVRGA